MAVIMFILSSLFLLFPCVALQRSKDRNLKVLEPHVLLFFKFLDLLLRWTICLNNIWITLILLWWLLSLYKSKESLSMCVCVYVCNVCLKCLCRSGSDWSESVNMAAAWFRGVQCLDYNDTFNKLFHKCFTNSASIVDHSHHSHVRTRANHCRAHFHDMP